MFETDHLKTIDVKTVDRGSNYEVVIAIGHRHRWRKFGGGQWIRRPETERDGRVVYEHEPAVHPVGIVSGETFAGLAAAHNKWLEDNRSKRLHEGTDSRQPGNIRIAPVSDQQKPLYAGDVNRMLVVVEYQKTNKPISDGPEYLSHLDLIRAIIQETIAAAAPALLKATKQ